MSAPIRFQLTCYGETFAVHDGTLDEAKRITDEHIRICPQGPMPWATGIAWHEVDYRPVRDVHKWVSAAGGQWLDHHVNILGLLSPANRNPDSESHHP